MTETLQTPNPIRKTSSSTFSLPGSSPTVDPIKYIEACQRFILKGNYISANKAYAKGTLLDSSLTSNKIENLLERLKSGIDSMNHAVSAFQAIHAEECSLISRARTESLKASTQKFPFAIRPLSSPSVVLYQHITNALQLQTIAPGSAHIQHTLASFYMVQRVWDPALQILQNFSSKFPQQQNLTTYFLTAKCYWVVGKFSEAIATLKKAFASNSASWGPKPAIFYFGLKSAERSTTNPGSSFPGQASSSLSASESFVEPQSVIDRKSFETLNSNHSSESHKTFQLNGSYPSADSPRSSLNSTFSWGNDSRLSEQLESMMQRFETIFSLKETANNLLAKKKNSQALETYLSAIKLGREYSDDFHPPSPILYSNASAAAQRLKEYERAFLFAQSAVALYPSYTKALIRQANLEARLGRLQDSLFHYNQAKNLDVNYPNIDESRLKVAYSMTGLVYSPSSIKSGGISAKNPDSQSTKISLDDLSTPSYGTLNYMNSDSHTMIAYGLAQARSPSDVVVMYFTATWCGPCQQIAPYMSQFVRKFPINVVFLKIDVDKCPQSSKNIRGVPNFRIFKGNKMVDQVTGGNVNSLEEKLKKHLIIPPVLDSSSDDDDI